MVSSNRGSKRLVASVSSTSVRPLLATDAPAPSVAVGVSTSTAPLLPAVRAATDIAVGASTSVVPLLPAVEAAPQGGGLAGGGWGGGGHHPANAVGSYSDVGRNDDVTGGRGGEVAGTLTSVATIKAPPRLKAEATFLEKNSSIKSLAVLAIGIKDANGAALIDLDAEPWTSLVSTTSRPQRDDLAEEVLCRYVSESLSDRPDMKRMPQPRNWDKKKLLKWLDDYPVTDTIDLEFLKDTVRLRRAAERNAKARAEAKESEEKSGGAWYGPIPMLRLIMALVDSDEIRHAYTKRNDISKD